MASVGSAQEQRCSPHQEPMMPVSPVSLDATDLIEIAKKANQSGNTAKVDYMLELALGCLAKSAPERKEPAARQSIPSQDIELLTTSREIYHYLCQMLRHREPGWRFTFIQMADYVESLPGLKLDRTVTTTERRERWRNHVSYSIEKLRAFGCIKKGAKNTEYVLIRRP